MQFLMIHNGKSFGYGWNLIMQCLRLRLSLRLLLRLCLRLLLRLLLPLSLSLRLLLCLCLSLILFSFTSFAQPDILHFERFTDEEGLPNNLFTDIIQDRHGVMWMSGLDGIARYDGYTVKAFRHSYSDTTSLSGNKASTLFEDSKGRLWVGVLGAALNVSDISKSRFQRMRWPLEEKERLAIRITDITEDSLKRIWVATSSGLFVIRETNEGFLCESFESIFPSMDGVLRIDQPTALYTGLDGRLWIGSKEGLFIADFKRNKVFDPDAMKGLPDAEIYDIEPDRLGRIWISCGQGPRLFYAASTDLVFNSLTGIPFSDRLSDTHIAFDLDNRLWATVFGQQAYGFDFKDSTLFLQSSINSDINHERFFRKPFVDHSGNAWLPVEGFYIYPYPKGFNTYIHPFAFHQSNSCIYADDDYLWFAYREKGIVRVQQDSGSVIHFSANMKTGYTIPVDHVQDILKVRSGNMIIVGFGNIAVMNPEGRILASYPLSGTNRAAYEDSAGRIWIGGYTGLHLFSEEKGIIQSYSPPAMKDMAGHYVQTIVEDSRGYIWYASDLRGLGRLDPASGIIQQFLPVEGDSNALPSFAVLDIAIDQQDMLWLATDVALVRFDPVTHTVTSFDHSDGLENDFISSVICTPDGMVWMSTHSGISSFDPVKKQFTNYGEKDGLSNYSYYSRSSYYSQKGVLYFGGKNGVDYFHPADLRTNPTAPIMFLSSLTVGNKQNISGYELGNDSTILHLHYKDKLLEFEIAGVHFANQKVVRYAYKMDGMQDEWVDLGNQRTVLFADLSPGKYVFRAKAISGDNVWSTREISIPIHIAPPLYATFWFKVLTTVIITGLIIFLVIYREKAIKHKDKQEAEVNRKIVELERRALQAQMNPHFIYNSMNSIQQFMIIHDIEGAMKYLTKFSRILRTVLNISAQNKIPLADEITLIKDYLELENMRFPDKFTYYINVSSTINIHTVEIPPFFIQPQVENAIRHGLLKKNSQGYLRIDISADESNLHIIVEDNGIGREASRKLKHQHATVNESKGLAIVEERLSHLRHTNGFKPFTIIDLYDTAGQATGTRVEIVLPID